MRDFSRSTQLSSGDVKVGFVPDVQQVWEEKPDEVPERFIREDVERPKFTNEDFQDLPIIDFSKLINDDEEEEEMSKFKIACEDWGFFQVFNHGVDFHVIDNMEKIAREFFMLPFEEKNKYGMAPGLAHGYGQGFVFSEEQKLDWCNMYSLLVQPVNTRDPQLWTTNPPSFTQTLETYSEEVRKFCEKMLEQISKSLGLKAGTLGEMLQVPVEAIRFNYYPPCARPDLVLGLTPHSDGSAFTVLHQGKDSPVGLHIRNKHQWLPVQVIQGALLINIGDLIEIMTNGKYKSVEHRAVANKERGRLSIVSYYGASYEADVGPLPELVDENNPCKYRTCKTIEYTMNYVSSRLNGKKGIDFAKLHPQN